MHLKKKKKNTIIYLKWIQHFEVELWESGKDLMHPPIGQCSESDQRTVDDIMQKSQ